MRTLKTESFLSHTLFKYGWLMSCDLRNLIRKVIPKIGEHSEIPEVISDDLINIMYDLQFKENLDDYLANKLIKIIRQYEIKNRKLCPVTT